MERPPDHTTERYLGDLRDAARVKRAAAVPLQPPPVQPVEPVCAPRSPPSDADGGL